MRTTGDAELCALIARARARVSSPLLHSLAHSLRNSHSRVDVFLCRMCVCVFVTMAIKRVKHVPSSIADELRLLLKTLGIANLARGPLVPLWRAHDVMLRIRLTARLARPLGT